MGSFSSDSLFAGIDLEQAGSVHSVPDAFGEEDSGANASMKKSQKLGGIFQEGEGSWNRFPGSTEYPCLPERGRAVSVVAGKAWQGRAGPCGFDGGHRPRQSSARARLAGPRQDRGSVEGSLVPGVRPV